MEMMVNDILRRNQLSITASRNSILSLFLNHAGALAHADIEKHAGAKIDRVTVYRTLQTFVDKGIIHTIPSNDNAVRYALCRDECSEGHHHDHHVHFVCERCNNTMCLDEVVIPVVKLPLGFKSTQVDVVVNGVCQQCNTN